MPRRLQHPSQVLSSRWFSIERYQAPERPLVARLSPTCDTKPSLRSVHNSSHQRKYLGLTQLENQPTSNRNRQSRPRPKRSNSPHDLSVLSNTRIDRRTATVFVYLEQSFSCVRHDSSSFLKASAIASGSFWRCAQSRLPSELSVSPRIHPPRPGVSRSRTSSASKAACRSDRSPLRCHISTIA